MGCRSEKSSRPNRSRVSGGCRWWLAARLTVEVRGGFHRQSTPFTGHTTREPYARAVGPHLSVAWVPLSAGRTRYAPHRVLSDTLRTNRRGAGSQTVHTVHRAYNPCGPCARSVGPAPICRLDATGGGPCTVCAPRRPRDPHHLSGTPPVLSATTARERRGADPQTVHTVHRAYNPCEQGARSVTLRRSIAWVQLAAGRARRAPPRPECRAAHERRGADPPCGWRRAVHGVHLAAS